MIAAPKAAAMSAWAEIPNLRIYLSRSLFLRQYQRKTKT